MAKIVDSAIRIKCSLDTDFFEKWFQILKPIHKLSGNEIRLIAEFCRMRYELGKKISDQEVLDEYLFSIETKQKIRDKLGINIRSYQVSMSKLKKANVIVGNRINPQLIPKLKNNPEDNKDYKLMLYFDMNGQ